MEELSMYYVDPNQQQYVYGGQPQFGVGMPTRPAAKYTQPLTPEIIDAIMAENGRDIEAAKKPFADYDSIKEQLQTAKDGLKAFDGVDVAQLQGQIATLNTQLADKDKEWQAKLDDMAFDNLLKDAIQTAKGRNDKAIRALLEEERRAAEKAERDAQRAEREAQRAAEAGEKAKLDAEMAPYIVKTID